jgi:hypothetical protein
LAYSNSGREIVASQSLGRPVRHVEYWAADFLFAPDADCDSILWSFHTPSDLTLVLVCVSKGVKQTWLQAPGCEVFVWLFLEL